MTRLVVGRFGLDIPSDNLTSVTSDGTSLVLSGRISYRGGEDHEALSSQLRELQLQDFYPVQISSAPELDGIYRLLTTSVEHGPGSKSIGWSSFSISLERASNDRTSLTESRLLGSVRPNLLAKTTCMPWQAVPVSAIAYTGPNTLAAPEMRVTEDGPVKVYHTTDEAMLDAFTSWKSKPEGFMNGAAKVLVGNVNVEAAARYTYQNPATQEYVVPAGVTKVRVDIRGAEGGGEYSPYRGMGNRIVCELDVVAGETLTLYCGRRGRRGGSGGGWPDGGDGGVGPFGSGWGGGGRSEIRRGATSLVIAGGGGGGGAFGNVFKMKQYRPGHGGVFGESAQTPTMGGKGGTWTSGGSGGDIVSVGSSVGVDGALVSGGDGGDGTVFGGGGGGGGYYGGGGGAGCWQYRTAGAGGGGSSIGTSQNETQHQGFQRGDGEIVISPIVDVVPAWLYASTGVGSQGSNYAWKISNGIIRLSPLYRSDAFMLQLEVWNGDEWSTSGVFQMLDNGAVQIPATATLTGMSILRNSPECCIVRCAIETGGLSQQVTVDITLRRGACMADVKIQGKFEKKWGWGVVGFTGPVTAVGSGLGWYQNTADSYGNKMMMATTYITLSLSAPDLWAGEYLNVVSSNLLTGIGSRPKNVSASESDIVNMWYAGMSESIKFVLS